MKKVKNSRAILNFLNQVTSEFWAQWGKAGIREQSRKKKTLGGASGEVGEDLRCVPVTESDSVQAESVAFALFGLEDLPPLQCLDQFKGGVERGEGMFERRVRILPERTQAQHAVWPSVVGEAGEEFPEDVVTRHELDGVEAHHEVELLSVLQDGRETIM